MTPLNYYLWGTVLDKCYADMPETIDALKDNIREERKKFEKIFRSLIDRVGVGYCMASRGSHLNEIIFHY